MKFLKRALVLVGLLILVACHTDKPYPVALQQAEHCLLQHPDSALIHLSTLDSTIQQEPEETQMYYALLKTKAMDKKFIKHTSDSLMTKVVRFYESYGDKNKLIEAYYYLGSVYRDMRDAPRALAAFQKAAEIGKNSQECEILGRIYSQIGTLFAYQSLYEDALKIYKKSYTYYLNEKDELGLVYALRNQGRMYESLNNPDSTKYYYQAAYKKAFDTKDQELINSISIELGNVYLDSGELDSAKKVFSRIPELEENAIYLKGLGHSFMLNLQLDSAQYYFQEALQNEKKEQNIYLISYLNRALGEIEAKKGNYHSAFDYLQKGFYWGDSIKETTRTEAIGKINALYNYQHTEEENQQLLLENEHQLNQIYSLIISLLIIIGAASFYINYTRKQKRIAEEQANRLSILKDEQYKNSQACIQENEFKIAQLEILLQKAEGEKDVLQENIELLQSQKAFLIASNKKIEMSLNEKECLVTSLKNSAIYQLFHQAVHQEEKLKSITEDSWKELQDVIDTTYNNFTKRLYGFIPKITQHELRICYLIKIEIQNKDIARILCQSTQAISTTRGRLYEKSHGEKGSAKFFDDFILDL